MALVVISPFLPYFVCLILTIPNVRWLLKSVLLPDRNSFAFYMLESVWFLENWMTASVHLLLTDRVYLQHCCQESCREN